MNIDRLSDDTDDSGSAAADHPRITESQPEPADPPKPELDPKPRPEQEPEPSRSDEPDSPAPADSTREPAEARSRQEHAEPIPTPEVPDRSLPQDGRHDDKRQAAPGASDRTSAANDREEPWEEDHPDPEQKNEGLSELTEPDEETNQTPLSETSYSSARTFVESTRPLSDQEHADREGDVFGLLIRTHEEELSTDYTYTTDPDRQQWTPERDTLHGQIVQEIYRRASEVPCEYKALIVGGLGGAGKSTILEQNAGIDTSRYMKINPDNIKEELALRGLVPTVEGLTPMEASDLVHEESSAIAKQLARVAQSEGKNLIWDITMSSEESTQRRIDDLRSAGYTQVDGLFVEIPIETSIRRMEMRHREGHDKYRAGIGFGGRFIPPEVIRNQADPEWGTKNRRAFEVIKKSLNNWELHDNGIDDRPAQLIDSSRHVKSDHSIRSNANHERRK